MLGGNAFSMSVGETHPGLITKCTVHLHKKNVCMYVSVCAGNSEEMHHLLEGIPNSRKAVPDYQPLCTLCTHTFLIIFYIVKNCDQTFKNSIFTIKNN